MCGFDKKHAIEVFREIELQTVKSAGFERENFRKVMVAAYSQLCKEKGKRRTRDIIGICEDMGNSPFFRDPKLFPNAAPVLGRAHHNFLVIAVSIGNREAQKYKIRQGGLDPVFDRIIITPNDDKVECVKEVMEDLNIDPAHSAFIGNSLRSDGASLASRTSSICPWRADGRSTMTPSCLPIPASRCTGRRTGVTLRSV